MLTWPPSAALPVRPDAACGATSLAPRLFFEDAAIWDIATKLKALIEGPQINDRLYREALERAKLEQELQMAAAIQQALLPIGDITGGFFTTAGTSIP